MAAVEVPLPLIASAVSSGRYAGRLIVADLRGVRSLFPADITSLVTNVSISYTMDMASQLTFEIVDPFNVSTYDLSLAKGTNTFTGNNYFIPGRDIVYETQTIGSIDSNSSSVETIRQLFEIADVTFQQGPGISPTYSVQCYTKAVQQMKRDRNPSAIKGSGTSFVYNAAKKYGLRFFGEQTSKKQTITKAKGSKQAESLWNVIDRLAGEAKFVCYEVNGVLVFASEKYLLNKWGPESNIVNPKFKDDKNTKAKQKFLRFFPVSFPSDSRALLQLQQFPTIRKSANDAYEGNGSLVLDRVNGTQLRPGMTIRIDNIPNFGGSYLVTDVSFPDMSAEPVTVNFRTPTKDEEKERVKDLAIGLPLQQTYRTQGKQQSIENITSSVKTASGVPLVSPWYRDARLRPLPTEENPFSYPRMGKANLTKLYNKNSIFSADALASTLEENTLLEEGNLDLWDRPVLVHGKDYKTLLSITEVITSSAPWKCVLLPLIYTDGGEPVQKTEVAVIAKYYADGGYEGSAKHLGVITGSTRQKAITNARDYAKLLSWQQRLILIQRFPGTPTNTAGGADSEWS